MISRTSPAADLAPASGRHHQCSREHPPGHGAPGGPPTDDAVSADVLDHILSEAWRAEAAEPVAIHVRPELQALIDGTSRPMGQRRADPAPVRGVPVVVDDEIPSAPGYEIHRASPPAAAPGG